jgi:hypothetical protein
MSLCVLSVAPSGAITACIAKAIEEALPLYVIGQQVIEMIQKYIWPLGRRLVHWRDIRVLHVLIVSSRDRILS